MSRPLLLTVVALLGPIATVAGQDTRALQRELDEMALNGAVTDDCSKLRNSRTMHALGDSVLVLYGRFEAATLDRGKALEAAVAARRCLVNAGVATELQNKDGTLGDLETTVPQIVIQSMGTRSAGVVFRMPRRFSIIDDDRTFEMIYDARVGRWAATHFAYLIGKADDLVEAVGSR